MVSGTVHPLGMVWGHGQNQWVEGGEQVVSGKDHIQPVSPYEANQRPSHVTWANIADLRTHYNVLNNMILEILGPNNISSWPLVSQIALYIH